MRRSSSGSDRKKNIAAVILGISHYNTLGMARSLGEADIPIYLVLKTTKREYVEYSRYIKESFHAESTDEIDFIIDKISRKYEKCILFPVSDKMAIYCDEAYDGKWRNVVIPGMKGCIGKYMEKAYSKEKAFEAGMHIPYGKIIFLEKENIYWDKYPCIIKPSKSISGQKCDIAKAVDADEFKKILERFKADGYAEVLVEEYIGGSKAYMVELMGERSDAGIKFGPIIRKIREYPLESGSTAYAEFVESQPGLDLESVSRYIIDSHFKGLFDMEFKYADDYLYFIECNFRNGAPNNAITMYGVNLPVCWIEGMLSESMVVKRHKRFTHFMVEQTDCLNMIKCNTGKTEWFRQYFNSEKIFWKYSDPVPCIVYYIDMIKTALRRIRGFHLDA